MPFPGISSSNKSQSVGGQTAPEQNVYGSSFEEAKVEKAELSPLTTWSWQPHRFQIHAGDIGCLETVLEGSL